MVGDLMGSARSVRFGPTGGFVREYAQRNVRAQSKTPYAVLAWSIEVWCSKNSWPMTVMIGHAATVGSAVTRSSKGGSQPSLTSICESRKVIIGAVACRAPVKRARISPSRSPCRISWGSKAKRCVSKSSNDQYIFKQASGTQVGLG